MKVKGQVFTQKAALVAGVTLEFDAGDGSVDAGLGGDHSLSVTFLRILPRLFHATKIPKTNDFPVGLILLENLDKSYRRVGVFSFWDGTSRAGVAFGPLPEPTDIPWESRTITIK